MYRLKRLCLWICGIVFVFSGVFKLQDPVGTSLIVEAYLRWMHLEFLAPASLAFAICLALLESFTGVALASGTFRRIIAPLVFSLMGVFTLISIFLVIFNPPMDCGCFGLEIHLTHAQTLIKNVILLALCCFGLIGLRQICAGVRKWLCFAVTMLLLTGFGIYSLVNLPVRDGTAYAIGESVSDMHLLDEDGADVSYLLGGERVVVVSVYDPSRLSKSDSAHILMLRSAAQNIGYDVVLLGSDGAGTLAPDSFFCDRKSLLTLNRSNGGITILSEGNVVAKRPLSKARHLATDTRLLEKYHYGDPVEHMISEQSRHDIIYHSFLIVVFALLSLL